MKNRKILLLLLALIFIVTGAYTKTNTNMKTFAVSIKEKAKNYPRLSSTLVRLMNDVDQNGIRSALQSVKESGLVQVKDNKVTVVIRLNDKSAITRFLNRITHYKGRMISTYENLVKVEIPLSALKELNTLEEVNIIKEPGRPFPMAITGEQVNLTGADLALSRNYTGAGIKVAVIDGGFYNLTAAKASHELPDNVITLDYSGHGIETETSHGTAVAEVIYDLATNAQLYLIKIDDEVDMGNAKDYCIANNIKIINHSMGWVNTEWGDGTGPICDIANDADAHGILWVNSAGNSAQRHWLGNFTDADHDNYNDFTDPLMNGEINEIGTLTAGEYVALFLNWNDTWGKSSNDYDLEIYYRTGLSWFYLAVSDHPQTGTQDPTEMLFGNVPYDATYGIRIKKCSGKPRKLQLFSFYHNYENNTPARSIVAPADASGAFTIGAIAVENWLTGPIENFSSQGPTQDERMKPDICGVDNNTNFIYGRFLGTSSASPCVAGLSAIVWSAYPSSNNNFIKRYLKQNAVDLGQSGTDTIYGTGRANLKIEGVVSAPADEGLYRGFTNLNFTWQKNTLVNDYVEHIIEISTNTAAPSLYTDSIGNDMSYTFRGAKNSKTYYARVRTDNLFDSGGYSDWSDGITIDLTPPSEPGTVMDEGELSDRTISFHWSAATDVQSSIAFYRIIISHTTNFSDIIFTGNSPTTNFLYSAPENGHYYARAAAVNRGGLQGGYGNRSDGLRADVEASVTSISPGPDTLIFNKVRVELTTSERDARIYYTLNDEGPRPSAEYEYKSPFYIEGNKTVKYFSVDRAGNIEKLKTSAYTAVIQPDKAAAVYNNLLDLSDPERSKLLFVFRDEGEYSIKIFNIKGEVIREWGPVFYQGNSCWEWDGVISGEPLNSNIYFARIESASFSRIYKFLVIK